MGERATPCTLARLLAPPLTHPSHPPSHPRTQVFYESANGVLLSEGFDGVIPPRFFTGAEDRRTGEALDLAEPAPPLVADGDAPVADGVGGGGGTPGE